MEKKFKHRKKDFCKKSVCIIIPVYEAIPTYEEQLSIECTISKMSNYEIFIVSPWSLDNEFYKKYTSCTLIKCHKREWKNSSFSTKYNYNNMLLSSYFYKRFIEYRYMLICQTDALILGNALDLKKIMDLKYDYIGGLFKSGEAINACIRKKTYLNFIKVKNKKLYIKLIAGNGGLSLRNVEKSLNLIKKYYRFIYCEEDVFFSYFGTCNNVCGFKTAPVTTSTDFSLNNESISLMYEGKIPFGIHRWSERFPDIITDFAKYF